MRREAVNLVLLPPNPAATTPQRDILPKNVKPLHYDLIVAPDLKDGTYRGSVSINLEAIEETTSITLNLKETKVVGSAVVLPWKTIGSKDLVTTYNEKAQTFTVLLRYDTISAGNKFSLKMGFQGSLDTSHWGFFRSSFIDPRSGETKWVASTQMEPVDARKAFPVC